MFKTLSSETKIFGGIIIATIVILGGAVLFFANQSAVETAGLSREQLVKSHNTIYGNASASAYLVEFSDFQCPACAAFDPAVQTIKEQYKDKLQFVYRHYPLPQHAFAEKAALAAEAAGKQGKFWEMHRELFKNQDKLSDETLNEIVKTIGLNAEQFTKDLDDSTVKNAVSIDKADGTALGVNSTPTFYLNGRKLRLTSPQSLLTEVENALK